MTASEPLHMTAFPAGNLGGNPAGVVLDAVGWSEERMLETARRLGYSESAFVTAPIADDRRVRVRYFTPEAEIPFCGHATIATAVAVAQRHGEGRLLFDTPVGELEIATGSADGETAATFRSVPPRVSELSPTQRAGLLELLGLEAADLDPQLPPRLANAGNEHPVLVLAEHGVFDGFGFDAAALRGFMDAQGWEATVTVLHRIDGSTFAARNLFPVGDIREDPATGSAAAAVGGYLRELGAVEPPAVVQIHQGGHVGRPSVLVATIPPEGGILVTGTAREITAGS